MSESQNILKENLSIEDILSKAKNIVETQEINEARTMIADLKNEFWKKINVIKSESLQEFISNGGNEIDFKYENKTLSDFNSLMKEFNKKKKEFYEKQELEFENNFAKKTKIIEDLKALYLDSTKNISFSDFKSLKEKWDNIGHVPKTKSSDIYKNFYHHTNNFFEKMNQNSVGRDKYFEENLKRKKELIQNTKELLDESHINTALNKLQIYHKIWKEDIGPVKRELSEEIWQEFKEASRKIHEKKEKFLEEKRVVWQNNLVKKNDILTKINSLFENEKPSDSKQWRGFNDKLDILKTEFIKSGAVEKEVKDEIWDKFKQTLKDINQSRNEFYKKKKKIYSDRLNLKKELLEKATQIKDDENWEETANTFKKLQRNWKETGFVPDKISGNIFEKFRGVCNEFFDRKTKEREEENKKREDNLLAKKEILSNIKAPDTTDEKEIMEYIDSINQKWKTAGAIPKNNSDINSLFQEKLDQIYSKLSIGKDEIELMKFKNKIKAHEGNQDFLDREITFIRKNITELNDELNKIENNLGFLSSSAKDNPLFAHINKNSENIKTQMKSWKEKLKIIRMK